MQSLVDYDLNTSLPEGPEGLGNWVRQVFRVEMGWFSPAEQEALLAELEEGLRPGQWDGRRWHMPNRRLRCVARKLPAR